MVHPCKQILVSADDNNIGCLIPHRNGAGTEGTMVFHGVDGSIDGGGSHLTHLTQEVDCRLRQEMSKIHAV
eukprot:2232424-Ditylum_brightwellii.AAC.1